MQTLARFFSHPAQKRLFKLISSQRNAQYFAIITEINNASAKCNQKINTNPGQPCCASYSHLFIIVYLCT